MPIDGPQQLLYEKKEQIAYITINRPERMNSLSVQAWDMLNDALEHLDRDSDVRVAIITGAGEKAFCVGMDMKEASEIKAGGGPDILKLVKDPMLQNVRKVKKPIIAAVNGMAFGGGFLLAQNCDLRIAVTGAQFGITEARVGRGSPWAVPLLWMLPLGIALELTLTGEPITAQRAYELGLVNKVVSRDQLMSTATAMAEAISNNAPLSVMAAKESFYKAMDLGCQAGFEKALEIYEPVYASEDAVEGPRAFAEKRKPAWKGR